MSLYWCYCVIPWAILACNFDLLSTTSCDLPVAQPAANFSIIGTLLEALVSLVSFCQTMKCHNYEKMSWSLGTTPRTIKTIKLSIFNNQTEKLRQHLGHAEFVHKDKARHAPVTKVFFTRSAAGNYVRELSAPWAFEVLALLATQVQGVKDHTNGHPAFCSAASS